MSLSVDIRASAGPFALDVSFAMESRTAALLGPSGAGKTLTLRAIAGLLSPQDGRITLDGESLYDSQRSIDIPVRKREIGYVFQDYALFPHLTVEENLAFGLRGVSITAVAHTISYLRLQGLEGRYPATLSGGERQRVALGRALASQPRLLLLDEPFSALDMPTRSALTEEFLELRAAIDVPMLLVTHDVGEAYALCDELIVIDGGRILQNDAKAVVFNQASSPEAARLVGVQNFLTGSVVETHAGSAVVDAAGIRITVDVPLAMGTMVQVGFRADAVEAECRAGGSCTLVRAIDRGAQVGGVFATADGTTIVAALGRLSDEVVPSRGWALAVRDGAAMVW
jgi:ABC-type sulfate/molybdate transport systems ATPase subunit